MNDLSFLPLKLDINAVYLTADGKIKLDITSYFHIFDIRMLTPFLLLVYIVQSTCISYSNISLSEISSLLENFEQQKKKSARKSNVGCVKFVRKF